MTSFARASILSKAKKKKKILLLRVGKKLKIVNHFEYSAQKSFVLILLDNFIFKYILKNFCQTLERVHNLFFFIFSSFTSRFLSLARVAYPLDRKLVTLIALCSLSQFRMIDLLMRYRHHF